MAQEWTNLMKKLPAFSLAIIFLCCASLTFSQQLQLIRGGRDSGPPPRPAGVNNINDVRPSENLLPTTKDLAVPQTIPTAVAEDLVLQWELVNPFRFISDQASIDELRRVYNELSEKNAYNLERALQDSSQKDVERERAAKRESLHCDNKQKDTERKKCVEKTKLPHPGWFARLAENDYRNTCWDQKKQKFKDEGACKDYINPKSHRVRVWINNSHLLGDRSPQWFKDDRALSEKDYDKCSGPYPKGFCIELTINYDSRDDARPNYISVKFSDNSFTIEPARVKVKDKLIVGLGDSYAAGEGNPDIPATFTKGKKDLDFLFGFKLQVAPRKDNDKVSWLDRRCHRSMYSYQFKTALQFALDNPQKSVTYVSYSCSGATTPEIMEVEQKSKEGGGKVPVQLDTLREALGAKTNQTREIDYLLLSTGGNDVGFSMYVSYVIVRGLARKLVAGGVNKEELKKSGGKFKDLLLKPVEGNYYRLHSALLNKENGIRIKGCEPEKPCDRILLTPYPDIFRNESEILCEVDRQEFDIPFLPDQTRGARLKLMKDYVYDPLNALQLTIKDAEIASKLGWTVVEGHLNAYSKHGFCAKNFKSTSTGEIFVMPLLDRNNGWERFDPRDYKPYEARQRWIKLPVDSKLTTDQMHRLLNIPVDVALEDDSSNIMHPTAEALAVHADANLIEIKRIEGRDDKPLTPPATSRAASGFR